MTLIHIVAAADNNMIGKDNQIPWRLPRDMRFFKNKTWGLPVIMGRKTFESLPAPLEGRLTIVLSKKKLSPKGVVAFTDLETSIRFCEQELFKEAMVIGGGEIYRNTLPRTSKIFLTRVRTRIDGDATYPEPDTLHWKLDFEEHFQKDEKNAYDMDFQTWTRLGGC